jgi:hypothetical protein
MKPSLSKKQIIPYFTHRFFCDIFIISSVTLLLLFLLEDFRPGAVSMWLDLRLSLLIPLVSGIIVLITSKSYVYLLSNYQKRNAGPGGL